MATYSRRAKLAVLIARVSVTVILFVLASLVLIQQDRAMKLELSIQKYQREIREAQNENKELQIRLAISDNLEHLEHVARTQLGMEYPEEVIFLKKKGSK